MATYLYISDDWTYSIHKKLTDIPFFDIYTESFDYTNFDSSKIQSCDTHKILFENKKENMKLSYSLNPLEIRLYVNAMDYFKSISVDTELIVVFHSKTNNDLKKSFISMLDTFKIKYK